MRKLPLIAMTTILVSAAIPAFADWNSMGSVKFTGPGSAEFMVPATARGMTSVGLMPQGASARCTHVVATFANGDTKELRLNTGRVSSGTGQFLAAGEVATVDIPGPEDMTQLELTCKADSGLRVTIRLLAG